MAYVTRTGYWTEGRFIVPITELREDGQHYSANGYVVDHSWYTSITVDRTKAALADANENGIEAAATRHPVLIKMP